MPIDPNDVFVTYFELPQYGIPKFTRKHLLDLQKRNQFPKAIELSPNRIAWKLSELLAWRASRPVARSVREAGDEAA
jgi:hypothetical protein